MVVKVKFEKGAVGAVHHHVHSQVTYVESGKFEFTINGCLLYTSSHDYTYRHSEHSVYNLSDDAPKDAEDVYKRQIKESMAALYQMLIDETATHEEFDLPYNLIKIIAEQHFSARCV